MARCGALIHAAEVKLQTDQPRHTREWIPWDFFDGGDGGDNGPHLWVAHVCGNAHAQAASVQQASDSAEWKRLFENAGEDSHLNHADGGTFAGKVYDDVDKGTAATPGLACGHLLVLLDF